MSSFVLAIGKERGYRLAHEVNCSRAADDHSPELLTSFESHGIEIYEEASAARVSYGVLGLFKRSADWDIPMDVRYSLRPARF